MAKQQDRYRNLTILHSNDLHGDFLAEDIDEKLIGGASMLSGYVNQVRRENPNSLYMIAGDMFRGSLIDSEFQGISTIEIMNVLGPDVVSLGNHEVDYGIAHLLFLEKCCKFPIVNANVYIKSMGTRLFKSHQILEVDGMKILVCGILTEEIMARAKKDSLLDTYIEVREAAEEVGIICDSYRNTDIDLTVLLTHIGFEKDVELAKQLKPEWGVDLIIGGHSHTFLDQPEKVNDILIVQAGIGTDQIGQFDLVVDKEKNCVDSFTWKIVPIDDVHCERNTAIEDLIHSYKKITDQKYGAILTTLTGKATHPDRYRETSVGNMFADILKEHYDLDLVLIGSGSLRKEQLGPVVTKGDLMDMYSYDEKLVAVKLTGAEIKQGMEHMLAEASKDAAGGHSEYYQISSGYRFVYDIRKKCLCEATIDSEEILDDVIYTVGLEGFHADNLAGFLSLDEEAVRARGEWYIVTTNIRNSIEEYMKTKVHIQAGIYGRTEYNKGH